MRTLSTIFKEAQKPWVDAGRHSWIVTQCSKELEKISIPVHEVRDLPPVPESGHHVLIGAAFYSLHDLELLDAVAITVSRRETSDERVDIFDVISCKSQADFDACLPGIGKVVQTPVVGIWKDGVLQEKASGHRAVQAIKRHYRLA